jgi:hypothetical protein
MEMADPLRNIRLIGLAACRIDERVPPSVLPRMLPALRRVPFMLRALWCTKRHQTAGSESDGPTSFSAQPLAAKKHKRRGELHEFEWPVAAAEAAGFSDAFALDRPSTLAHRVPREGGKDAIRRGYLRVVVCDGVWWRLWRTVVQGGVVWWRVVGMWWCVVLGGGV